MSATVRFLKSAGWRYIIRDSDDQLVASAGGWRSESEAQLEALAYIDRVQRADMRALGAALLGDES